VGWDWFGCLVWFGLVGFETKTASTMDPSIDNRSIDRTWMDGRRKLDANHALRSGSEPKYNFF